MTAATAGHARDSPVPADLIPLDGTADEGG